MKKVVLVLLAIGPMCSFRVRAASAMAAAGQNVSGKTSPADQALAASFQPITQNQLATTLNQYQGIAALEANFKQIKKLKDLDIELKSEGSIKLVRPDQITWEITKPSYMKVVIQGEGLTIYIGKGSEEKVQSFKRGSIPDRREEKALQTLVSWMSLKPDVLFRQYRVLQNKTGAMQFEPRQPDVFKNMEMILSPNGHVRTLMINETSGDQMTILFDEPHITRDSKTRT